MLDNIKIMQFADGTLDSSEREEVRKQIDTNPEYQKILKDYMDTADILANLGNEIRSVELPNELRNKISTFNQKEKKKTQLKSTSFNFFNIFKLKYSAIAAAFAVVFTFGFYTNQILVNKNQIPSMQTVSDSQNIQLRGSSSETVASFYTWFNEDKFMNSINKKTTSLKIGEKFTAEMVDANNQTVHFIIDKEFKNNDDKLCKIISYDKKVTLENSNKSYYISMAICNENNIWKLIAITLN